MSIDHSDGYIPDQEPDREETTHQDFVYKDNELKFDENRKQYYYGSSITQIHENNRIGNENLYLILGLIIVLSLVLMSIL